MSAHDSKHSKGHAASTDSSSGVLPFAPTLRKLTLILLVGFTVPVVLLVLIAHFIASESAPPAQSQALSSQATEQRIAPVAQASSAAPAAAAATTAAASAAAPAATSGAAPAAAAGTTVADAGKKLFESACIACHGAGVAGAPKFGDKAAWAPIIAQGKATLYDHAIHGYTGKLGMMPPKGGSTASDDDVKAAVDYIVSKSQ